MTEEYRRWIEQWLDQNRAYGKCHEGVKAMKEAFPELIAVPGHVSCDWGLRDHWWLTDPNGNVVDPTVSQFGVVFSYQPWKPGDEVRVGKCMNCGSEIWRSVQTLDPPPKKECICNETCSDEFEAYLEDELKSAHDAK